MQQMAIEAEAFKSEKLRMKSIVKGMIEDIDQMMDVYKKKIDQYTRELSRFKSQRNVLAKILTD